jgi:hypothetical protein
LLLIFCISSLKGEKISPVLINGSNVNLLVELKRPPVILHTYSHNLEDGKYDTRMPGTPLIGRANAWLFQLTGNKVADDYITTILRISYSSFDLSTSSCQRKSSTRTSVIER